VLVPTLDDEEQTPTRPPASEIASVAVQCQLCSSRFYAKPSQLGQKMKCPDCHTENVVAEAESRAPKKHLPKLSELTDDEDFKLSDPVETPRYQALTRDALQFERALRSSEGMDVKPLDVDAKPVHRPPSEPKSRSPAPTLPSDDDDLIDLGPEPGPPASPPKHHAAAAPAVEDNLIEMGPFTEVPPIVPRETKPIEPQTPAGSDDIDLFPEDRLPPTPPPKQPTSHYSPLTTHSSPTKPQSDEFVDLGDDEEEAHIEVRVQAPVQRVEYKPVITLPKADKPDDSDYGAEVDMTKLKNSLTGLLQGSGGEALPPDLANRKPFSPQALFAFLQPGVIGRCVALIAIVVGEFWAMGAITNAMASGSEGGLLGAVSQISALFIYLPTFFFGIVAFLMTAMYCFTIVQDTANGQDKIESWPEFSMYAWFESAMYFAAAFFLGGLPGALLSVFVSLLGLPSVLEMLMTPLLVMTSLVLLFPPVLISMLEAGSVMEPMSMHMLRSFSPLRKFWITFYLLSLAIGFVGIIVFHIAFNFGWFTMLPGAALLTFLPFLYFRLLGRMAMMYRDYIAAITPDEEEPGPVVRHVIQ